MVLTRRLTASILFFLTAIIGLTAREFPYPTIPEELRTPAERASYLITHFWEKADFSDSREIEQGFADFISVFAPAESEARAEAMRRFVKASGGSPEVAAMVEDYLYTPASPVYDEEYFILFLQAQIESDLLTEEMKVRPKFLLEEAMLNRVGTPANDFSYTLQDGSTSTLRESLPDSGEMLLFFYDPTCDVCHHFMARLLEIGCDLPVLAIYPDEDEAEWRAGLPSLPDAWRAGMADVMGLYSIREFPSVYLISHDGIVIRKNISESDLPLSGR